MKKLLCLALLAQLLTAGLALAQSDQPSWLVGQVPDRVVITVSPGLKMALDKSVGGVSVGVPALDGLAQKFSVKDMEQLYAGMTGKLKAKSSRDYLDRVWAVDFPAEMDLHQVKAAYEALPEVEEVRLVDICRNFAYLPDDPNLGGAQWYLRNMNFGGADIRAVGGWNQSLGDSNIVVCVLDSGVDWHHPDLGGPHPDKVNGAIWTNWAEYYGSAGVDDDSNGKVDDIRGWDFVHVPGDGYPDEDDSNPDNDPMDYGGHGTACSGCVAPITNNGIGIAGTAPGCKIMAVRCGWLPDGTEQGLVRMDFASQGMIYAAANGANIINCSWGSSEYLDTSVSVAQGEGCLVVTAAGNDDSTNPPYLGTRSGVVAVAATNSSDAKAGFSNYGDWVEISAPGVDIYTTYYNHVSGESTYTSIQGTSFSSPLTAGAAALVWSANPGLTYQQVANLLYSGADDLDAINPTYAGLLGAGRVNLLKTLGDGFHRFPDEFPTLFDAFNESAVGDTIAVLGGASSGGPVTIPAKELKFLGGYNGDYSSRDPLGDPGIISGTLSSPGLSFNGASTAATVVDGFRVQGGGGIVLGGSPYFGRYGGGIVVDGCSPTLRNLDVTGNQVGSSMELGCGGGVMIGNSTATLENVLIHGNSGIYGAGLYVYNSQPTLIGCQIYDNVSIFDNLSYPPAGGGMHVLDSQVTMTDCTVSGHLDLPLAGGIYAAGYYGTTDLDMTGGEISGNSADTFGAGLYMDGGQLSLRKVTFDGNTKLLPSFFMQGGACYATNTTATLDSLTVTGNTASIGAGIFIEGSTDATLTNSVFSGNNAAYYAGASAFNNVTSGAIAGNTITGNTGTSNGGAGLYVTGSTIDVENNIMAFNTGATAFGNALATSTSTLTVACNDAFSNDGTSYSGIDDPTGTNGNIAEDPLFCKPAEGDFKIAASSPCAPANSGSCGLIGALSDGCGDISVPDGEAPQARVFRVDPNFPNPFNPVTTIRFSLATPGRTTVTIYDLAGRHISTLLDDMLPAKQHEVTWRGTDDKGRAMSAGVYFFLVKSGQDSSVGRMALVR